MAEIRPVVAGHQAHKRDRIVLVAEVIRFHP
jgi:hypothetical protein